MQFAEGTKVLANFAGGGFWEPGVITNIHIESGTADIEYDDGDEEAGVPMALIKEWAQEESSSDGEETFVDPQLGVDFENAGEERKKNDLAQDIFDAQPVAPQGTVLETYIVIEVMPSEAVTSSELADALYSLLSKNVLKGVKRWVEFSTTALAFGMLSLSITFSLGIGGSVFLVTQGLEAMDQVQCATLVRSFEIAEPDEASTSSSDAHENAAIANEKLNRSLGNLQSMEEAHSSNVVSIPGLLSADELSTLIEVCEKIRSEIGTVKRGANFGTSAQIEVAAWQTVYLNTNNLLKKYAPELYHKFADTLRREDAAEWGLFARTKCSDTCAASTSTNSTIDESISDSINVRVAEFHTVLPGGGLADPSHYDWGSLLTLDIMLSDPSTDFEGGQFALPENGSSDEGSSGSGCDSRGGVVVRGITASSDEITNAAKPGSIFQTEDRGSEAGIPLLAAPGDAIIFPSHKHHMVEPVRSGCRRVCVIEFWSGVERQCSHRCDRHWGGCPFVREEAKRSHIASNFLTGGS
jgi:hypothetical protein